MSGREAWGTLYFRPHGAIDPFKFDWFIAPGIVQSLLAGHLLDLTVQKAKGENHRIHVFCAESDAIMTTVSTLRCNVVFPGPLE